MTDTHKNGKLKKFSTFSRANEFSCDNYELKNLKYIFYGESIVVDLEI